MPAESSVPTSAPASRKTNGFRRENYFIDNCQPGILCANLNYYIKTQGFNIEIYHTFCCEKALRRLSLFKYY